MLKYSVADEPPRAMFAFMLVVAGRNGHHHAEQTCLERLPSEDDAVDIEDSRALCLGIVFEGFIPPRKRCRSPLDQQTVGVMSTLTEQELVARIVAEATVRRQA